jgi:hypothetical protein
VTDVLLGILCIVVAIQVVRKEMLSQRDNAILNRVEKLSIKVEAYLSAIETHSRLNQENKNQLRDTLEKMKVETVIAAKKAESITKEAKEEIKKEVPERVVEKIQEMGITDPFRSSDSSVNLKPKIDEQK